MRPTPPHPLAIVLALTGAGVVALLTLGPRPVVAPLRGIALRGVDRFAAPLLSALPEGVDIDQVFNALLFLPLGAGIAALLPLRWWPVGPVAGLIVSLTVETLQTGLPGRVPDLDDVVWNTLGATAGAGAVLVLRLAAAAAHALTRSAHRPA